ncbi:hypothetical protein LX36DRAFT_707212 [Colletotrichum falcatum]|nr:hypothetical protein LX36DRAFT_707212 [Colletotrichum falcatum]
MQLSILLGASSAVLAAAASFPPINLGYYAMPQRVNQIVAWSPSTPTTTQELAGVCNEQGPFYGTPTWTAIRTVSTYAYAPVCRNPFSITDVETNTTYHDLELACVDDDIDWNAWPEVTAVVDRATNEAVETCVPATGLEAWCGDGPFQHLLRYEWACKSV